MMMPHKALWDFKSRQVRGACLNFSECSILGGVIRAVFLCGTVQSANTFACLYSEFSENSIPQKHELPARHERYNVVSYMNRFIDTDQNCLHHLSDNACPCLIRELRLQEEWSNFSLAFMLPCFLIFLPLILSVAAAIS